VSFETAFYILEWTIRIGALAIVPARRTPAATRGWLLLIFFLPVPGLLLFLAIGRPRFPAWRIERFRALMPLFDSLAARMEEAHPGRPAGGEATAALARHLGRMPAVGGNGIELIEDYDGTIDRLVADIDEARHHVRLVVYIFANDRTGRRVIAALARAVLRGVACQVLLDPVGSHHWRHGTIRELTAVGVDVREALPFRLLRGRTRRDMRNHRKLFVIDGLIGYTGSQNIVDRDFRPGIVNRELVARVTGPVVAEMEMLVRADWYLETVTMPAEDVYIPAATGGRHAQILPSGAEYPLEGFETLLVWQIHQARRRVVLTTPYFIPDEDVLGAMRTAVARGVTVELIISAAVDQRLVNLAQCSYYSDLMRAGVCVHLFRGELLHAKNVSVDGTLAILGSSNVDLRSFQLNDEVSLLLFDDASVADVERVQQGYLAGSDRLTRERWNRRPALRKLAENIARLLSPLL